jgi:hypothetical protein
MGVEEAMQALSEAIGRIATESRPSCHHTDAELAEARYERAKQAFAALEAVPDVLRDEPQPLTRRDLAGDRVLEQDRAEPLRRERRQEPAQRVADRFPAPGQVGVRDDLPGNDRRDRRTPSTCMWGCRVGRINPATRRDHLGSPFASAVRRRLPAPSTGCETSQDRFSDDRDRRNPHVL